MTEPIARLRIEMQEIEPKVWRTVEVPTAIHLHALHDVLQVAFDWWEMHLWEFLVGDRVYGDPVEDDWDPDHKVYKAKSVRLRDLIGRGVDRFVYVYDFGDYWRHDITIDAVEDGAGDAIYPRLVAGARRAPPEDVGGVTGFFDFLEAVLDPSHEDHEFMTGWYGGSFDPDDIEEDKIRSGLRRLAERRQLGRQSYLKSLPRR